MIDQTAQRTMQVPGQGIIPAGRPIVNHKEYPKHMAHPQFQPGKPGPEVKSPHGFTYHVGGTSIRFPPVLVRTPEQEEYHKSLGYETVGKSDPDAFNRAVGAGQIPDHVAYVPLEYPKWVQGKLVHSKEEELRLSGSSEPAPEPAVNHEVATLLDQPGIGDPPVETTEEKRARLLRELAELDEPKPDLNFTQNELTDTLTEYSERFVKPVTKDLQKKAKAAKKARKQVVLTAQQKTARSDAIKAGLARKKAKEQENAEMDQTAYAR